jgi:hypothetical protein
VTARAIEIQSALRAPQLEAAPAVTSAYGVVVGTLVHIIGELNTQITALEATPSRPKQLPPDLTQPASYGRPLGIAKVGLAELA